MSNKWFIDTFLPSLFQRGREYVLTAKQVNVCSQYMEPHIGSYTSAAGNRYSSNWYSYQWRGRSVTVSAQYPNGCAMICFGLTAEEAQRLDAEEAARKETEHADRINRIKANPEKLEKWLARYTAELMRYENELRAELENDPEEENIHYWENKINELKAKIAELTA